MVEWALSLLSTLNLSFHTERWAREGKVYLKKKKKAKQASEKDETIQSLMGLFPFLLVYFDHSITRSPPLSFLPPGRRQRQAAQRCKVGGSDSYSLSVHTHSTHTVSRFIRACLPFVPVLSFVVDSLPVPLPFPHHGTSPHPYAPTSPTKNHTPTPIQSSIQPHQPPLTPSHNPNPTQSH